MDEQLVRTPIVGQCTSLTVAFPGQNPDAAPTTLDTYVDNDASEDVRPVDDAVHGATSKDVYASLGQPMSNLTSNELHHGGQQGRKRDGQGVDQWGPPGQKNTELDRAQRVTKNDLNTN